MTTRQANERKNDVERALGFKTYALHNYLKRRQQKPYLGRYEVERG